MMAFMHNRDRKKGSPAIPVERFMPVYSDEEPEIMDPQEVMNRLKML